MMALSDRHCRYLWRLLSRHTRLYTEMVTTGALLQGDSSRFLAYHPHEHPLALQLGGSDPKALAQCARLAEKHGYDEVNLNCGCPSNRVQNGLIGACLMAHPQRVADAIKAMRDAVSIPITVKHRIGIDTMDDSDSLQNFVIALAEAGCQTFIIHARKAWLQGLNPKQNRDIPPLMYDRVYALKQALPQLTVVINGGIQSLQQSLEQLQQVDGVMMGRQAYHNPYLLAEVDKQLFHDARPVPSRRQVMLQYIDYCAQQLQQGCRLHHMSKHVLGLFQGQPGARAFRRHISEHAYRKDADIHILHQALANILCE